MLTFLKDWKEMVGKTVKAECDDVLLFTDGSLSHYYHDWDYDSCRHCWAGSISQRVAEAFGIVKEWEQDAAERQAAESERQRAYHAAEKKRREENDLREYERLRAKYGANP